MPTVRMETQGTIVGAGLTGTFHTWQDGERERDDEQLGVRRERTLRIGDRAWVENANGNVRELHGVLLRRARTEWLIESGNFVHEPERVRYLRSDVVNGRRSFVVEVTANQGSAETVYIDATTFLPARFAYVDGDGMTTVDPSDWRTVEGHAVAYRSVVSDGERAFDLVQTTTDVKIGRPIDETVFAPFRSRQLGGDAPATIPLVERDGHYFCVASVNGRSYTFLIDSGAQNILIDSRVARELGLVEEGALEIRGTQRSGGLHTARIARLQLGSVYLDDVVASSIDIASSTGGLLKIDGILGYPLFASGLVKLDFAHRAMLVGPPGSFKVTGAKLDLDVDRGLAETLLQINGAAVAPFIVDTGSTQEVLLFRPYVDRHPGVVPFTGIRGSNFGFGGASNTYRTELGRLNVGGFELYHRSTDVVLETTGAFADRFAAGNVGLGVLRNFVLTFDEPNAALYVERGADFDDGRRRNGSTNASR